MLSNLEAYLELKQICKMELFAKKINYIQRLTILSTRMSDPARKSASLE